MRQKGLDGEALAAEYLKGIGYKLVSKNFHSRFGEIDLIVLDKTTIVFVEVKLRTNRLFGTPLEAITYSKLEKIKKTALYFLTVNNLANKPYRLDAIEIERNNLGENSINHVKNITL